jgi:serine protease Do
MLRLALERLACLRMQRLWLLLAALGCLASVPVPARASQTLAELEERAVKAAVAQIAPSVVRIETVGGLERVGQFLVGTGPTTGVVVSSDGLIVSSAFNFIQRPDSILVTLPDGTRLPAKLVATDHSRMLVLLSVHPTTPLTAAESAPPGEMRVGQWAIAVGRTLSAETPNVSVGIVSALDRVWGRAIQTDAKISPTNYGGPLVDISGRVLGVLAPLSPDSASAVAGVEWYDSGIGFAVPLAGVQTVLPRLAAGTDLYPGVLGIGMKPGDFFSQAAEIAACRPRSPASAAGLKAGDTIVEINGKPITRQAQFKQELNRHYAGDHVRLVVTRSGERIERDIELTDKIDPYEFPFAGLLPMRALASKPTGLIVRQVYPDSPAAHAGIQAGDQVLSLGGTAVQTADEAMATLRSHVPGDKIAIEIRRNGETLPKELELGRLPEDIPSDLPAAHAPVEAKAAEPAVGVVSLEMAGGGFAYVPTNYHSDLRYGVVIWLHGAEADKQEELVARWKPRCEARDLILLAPKSADPNKWQSSDVRAVRQALDELSKKYAIDPTRVVVHGYQQGAAMAYLLGFGHAETIRSVAVVGGPLPTWVTLPENDPLNRLAIYSAATTQEESVKSAVEAGVVRLRAMKYPVTTKTLDGETRYLADGELDELVRWIDTLDRF